MRNVGLVREIAQSSANQFPVAGCAEVTAGDHAGLALGDDGAVGLP